jgi:hypothetical protein
VLVAARDIQAAATVLGPSSIPFVQAPHLPKGIPLAHRATGYADILLSQGWSDQSALWGLTHAWLNIFQLFRPDKLVLDYSPTVSLAAYIARIPTVLVGNGFELPPLTSPLPPFPGFSWAVAEIAVISEAICVKHANTVVQRFGEKKVGALRDLMRGKRVFLTYKQLDHYGQRDQEEYVGAVQGSLSALQVDWPKVEGPKIFVCVRPDTARLETILSALTIVDASVICVAPGIPFARLLDWKRDNIVFCGHPIDLASVANADLCISYGAEGTMLRMLLSGVPQLVSPWHVETYMALRRLEVNGLGAGLYHAGSAPELAENVTVFINDARWHAAAKEFAKENKESRTNHSIASVLERLAASSSAGPRAMLSQRPRKEQMA